MNRIKILLKYDPASALRVIKDQTYPTTGIRILRIMKDPWYWGKIEKNRIKIWPKGPNKDISSAYIWGHINEAREESVFFGKIVNDPIFKVPSWLLALSALLGFPSFGYLMYSFMSRAKTLSFLFR